MTLTGRTLGAELDAYSAPFMQSIVRPFSDPIAPHSTLVVLRGNIAPDGAVLKASAMSSALRQHRGRAVVFKSADDMLVRIDDPDLDVDPTSMYDLHVAPLIPASSYRISDRLGTPVCPRLDTSPSQRNSPGRA